MDTITNNSNTTTFTFESSGTDCYYTSGKSVPVYYPERSEEWKCELFGTGECLVLIPRKDKVPNWFWRKMQYLILGNKWVRTKTTSS